jgi:hypothetical protein
MLKVGYLQFGISLSKTRRIIRNTKNGSKENMLQIKNNLLWAGISLVKPTDQV